MPTGATQVVLVVDDDVQIQKLIGDYLPNVGFTTVCARSRHAAFEYLATAKPSLILLDLHLPDGLGFDIAREIRTRENLPIIMLTGSQDEYDRIAGLEGGADDYMSKPFSMRELLARMRAVLRRYDGAPTLNHRQSITRFANWALDLDTRVLRSNEGAVHHLTDHEYQLLKVMLEHPQRVLTRDFLLDATRNDAGAVFDRTIDYHIMNLRRKIEMDPRRPQLIKTERNAGYTFSANVERT